MKWKVTKKFFYMVIVYTGTKEEKNEAEWCIDTLYYPADSKAELYKADKVKEFIRNVYQDNQWEIKKITYDRVGTVTNK